MCMYGCRIAVFFELGSPKAVRIVRKVYKYYFPSCDRIVIVGIDDVLKADDADMVDGGWWMVGSRRRQLSSTVIWSSRKASVSLHVQQAGCCRITF